MITFSNYDTEITKIPISKAPEAIQNGHAFYGKAKELYSKSDAIKKTIDLYITKLNEYAGKNKSTSKTESLPKNLEDGVYVRSSNADGTEIDMVHKLNSDGESYFNIFINNTFRASGNYADMEKYFNQMVEAYSKTKPSTKARSFKVGQTFEVLKNNVLNAKKGDTFTITEYNDFIWVGSESFRPSLFKDLITDKVIKLKAKSQKPKFKSGEKVLYNGNERFIITPIIENNSVVYNIGTSENGSSVIATNVPENKITKQTKNSKTGKVYTKTNFTEHVKLAKRFVSFFNKEKTLAQVENLHKAIQKAVIEGSIPTTEYFNLMVDKTPKMLAYARKMAPKKTILTGLENAIEQQQIIDFANAATKWPSVNLLKRYIAIANTTGKVDASKIERLNAAIKTYIAKMNTADPFAEVLKNIAQKGINSNTVTDFRLNGIQTEVQNLQGIAKYLGCAYQNINFAEPKK